jgi:DNA polymerase III delta subunit
MMALIQDRALRKGITRPLSRGVVTHLVDCLGTDTGAVDSELEKLICYCGGPDQEITMEAARELCTGQGESVNWALGEALGDRRPQTALEIVDKLLYTAKDAESTARQLVGTVARHYRDLLQVRVFMQEHRFRDDRQVYAFLNQTPRPDLSDELAQGLEIVTGHPYRLRVLARQSRNYRGTELVDAVIRAADAYWLCISSAQSCRVVLEKLVLDLTAAVPTATRGRRTG